MEQRYSTDLFECPHCATTGFMLIVGHHVVNGVEWDFQQCPHCLRWMATREGEEIRRLFNLPFLPLKPVSPNDGRDS